MTNLSKHESNVIWKYYIYNDDLYKLKILTRYMPDDYKNLQVKDLLNKYNGGFLYIFDYEYNDFKNCDLKLFNFDEAKEINNDDLDNAIEQVKSKLKKKFEDFCLNNTLYSCNFCSLYQCFPTIVKPIRKLIYENIEKNCWSLILEIEVLDGRNSTTKHEFIPFSRFIKEYSQGHKLKIIDSSPYYNFKVDDYFDFGYFNIEYDLGDEAQ